MLRVVSFGTLAADPRFFRQHVGGVVPYPVGYTIERNVFRSKHLARTKVILPGDEEDSDHAHVADVYYRATIIRGSDGSPLFEVTRSDKPDAVHVSDNPSTAWRSALEAAVEDFPGQEEELCKSGRDSKGVMMVHGQKWYGLSFERVLEGMKTLDGAVTIMQGGKSTHRSTKGEKRSRSSSVVSPSPPPAAAASAAQKNTRATRSKPSAASSQQTNVDEDAEAPAKKQRTGLKARSATTDDDNVPLFILASSKLSKVKGLCPDCGLNTAFCHLTGKPHTTDEKPRRGASPQGAAPAKRRLAAKKADERKTSVKTQPQNAQKRSCATKVHKGDIKLPEEPKEAAAKFPKQRGGVKGKEKSTETPRRSKLQEEQKRNDRELSVDSDDIPLLTRCMNGTMTPAPQFLRPPLAVPESQKALQTLQRLIRSEDVIHAPFLSLLHLPSMPAGRQRTVTRKVENGAGSDQNGDEEDEDAGVKFCDGTISPSAATDDARNKGLKNTGKLELHPLDITDLSLSIAGKRYVRFMQLYTSERAKMDLLKKADSVPAVPRTRSGINKSGAKMGQKHSSPDVKDDIKS